MPEACGLTSFALDAFADDVQGALERRRVVHVQIHAERRYKELANGGTRRARRDADVALVHGHVTPAKDAAPALGDQAFDTTLGVETAFVVRREEHHADVIGTDFGQTNAQTAACAPEKGVWDLHEHSRAVARLGVGGDGAAMREVLEQLERAANDLRRALALCVGNESDAAAIVLVRGIVQALPAHAVGEVVR